MRGRKVLKVVGWLVGIGAVLATAGYVTLRVMLPPEKLRAMALPRIEQALGQRVEVGSFHLAVWGGFGVAVEDLRIGNRPGYADDQMLELEKIVLRIPLRPLLRRELEITKIEIVRPEVFIEKSPEGGINVAGLGQRLTPGTRTTPEKPSAPGPPERTTPAAPEQPPETAVSEQGPPSPPVRAATLPAPIHLESLTIEDGSVRFRDSAAGFTAHLRGLQYGASLSVDTDLQDIRAEGILSTAVVSVGVAGMERSIPEFTADVAYRARVDFTTSVLSLDEVKVSILGAVATVTGTVVDFIDPVLHLKTELSTDLSTLPLGEAVRASGKLNSNLRAEGPVLKPDNLNLMGTLTLDGGTLENPQMPVPLKNLAVKILFKGQDVEIPNLSGSLGTSSFRFAADVAGAIPFAATGGKGVPTIRFELACPHLAADEFLPDPESSREAAGRSVSAAAGPTAGAEPAARPVPPVPEMNARGTVSIERISAKRLEASGVSAVIELAERRLAISEFVAGLYAGRIRGSADADFGTLPDVPVAVSVVAESVAANDFISALTSFDDHLFGKLNLNGELEWRGITPEEIRQTLSGRGGAHVSEGRIVNWDLARDLSQWIKFLEFEDVHFKDMNLEYAVADERVTMHPLRMKALDTSWEADGSVGFDESLDYRVTATLSPTATRSLRDRLPLPPRLTANVKQAELVFFVTGSAKSPEFRWDAASVTDRVEEQVKEEVRDFLEGKKGEAADALLKEVDKHLDGDAKDKVRDLLEGIVKPDSTDSTSQDQKLKELKKEGEELLKDLFGKKKKP